MSIAKLFTKRSTRLLAFSIFVAGVFAIASAFSDGAFACPGPPPQPLRELYVISDLVVVARVGKSEITKVENYSDDINVSTVKTTLVVSSTLKGEPQSTVYINRMLYGAFPDQLSNISDSDTFLAFLSRDEEGDGYHIDNMTYGLKQLSEADLKVYVSRIEELASIMKAENPSDEEIVAWLVRCAEEPATRWEGSYELAMSHYLQQSQEDVAEQDASSESEPNIAEVQTVETPVDENSSDDAEVQDLRIREVAPIRANLLELLTTAQKDRLVTTLINGATVTDRDYYLIDVVQTWDDPRLVPYLLSQLRQIDIASSYIAENLMTIVAQKLGSETLKSIVEKLNTSEYIDPASYADDDTGEQDAETTARNDQREADEEQAAVQRRRTSIEYFIAIAENTAPKTVTEEPVDVPASTQP